MYCPLSIKSFRKTCSQNPSPHIFIINKKITRRDKKLLKKLKEKAVFVSKMPKDITLGLPLITMAGNIEITVENFKGIIEYSDETIRIKVKNGIVAIEGSKLFLTQVTSEIINITGTIRQIKFL